MPRFEGEVISHARGRGVVCFTTPSGVRAIAATDMPPAALGKLIAAFQRKIARRRRAARNRH